MVRLAQVANRKLRKHGHVSWKFMKVWDAEGTFFIGFEGYLYIATV